MARPRKRFARSTVRRSVVAADAGLRPHRRCCPRIGIGANATVFTIVNTVLLRPLPFERADDVVQVRRRTPFGSSGSFPMTDYLALTTQRGALSALAILDVLKAGRYTLVTNDAAEPTTACRVSAQFFAVLGVSPVRGRLFTDGDDVPGRTLTAVITRAFWSRRFASDPAIVGTSLTVGGKPYTVIGVAPDTVRAFSAAEMYLSLPVPDVSTDRTNSFQVLGRVASGVGRPRAEAQIDTIARRHAQANASLTNMSQGIVLHSLQDDFAAPIRPALQALMVAVGLVLLIACSNVANLVLARALARRREIAVMAALGASRWRIAQRVLAENMLVAFVGGGAGLLLAYVGVRALPALSAANLPQADRIHIDEFVIVYVTATATGGARAPGAGTAIVSCWYRPRSRGCVLPCAFSAQSLVRDLRVRWPDNPHRDGHNDGGGRRGYISTSGASFENRPNACAASGVVDRAGVTNIVGVRNDRAVCN